jgi:hypothetical protein
LGRPMACHESAARSAAPVVGRVVVQVGDATPTSLGGHGAVAPSQ